MVEDKLHPVLSRVVGSLLLAALLGTSSWAGFGPPGQIQPNTPQAIARSAAEKASSQATQGQGGAPPASQKKVRKVRPSRRAAARPRTTRRSATPSITGHRLVIIGRRDPFRLPGAPGRPGEQPPEEAARGPLPPGTRGLVINQLKLQGVVRMDLTNQMIAVVVPAYANRAYFLRENDSVFNGVVSKITPDSIYFKENFLDQYGRAQVREVVKRLGTVSGEGR